MNRFITKVVFGIIISPIIFLGLSFFGYVHDAYSSATWDKYIRMQTTVDSTTNTAYTYNEILSNIWYYDADNYDVVTGIYFEGAFVSRNVASSSYVALFDKNNNYVTSSEISTNNTTTTIVRSANISSYLNDNTEYVIKLKADAGNTVTVTSTRILINQSGEVSKTETDFSIGLQTNAGTSYSICQSGCGRGFWLFTSTSYSGNTREIYFEADIAPSVSTETMGVQLYNVTNSVAVTSSEVTLIGNTTTTRVRSGNISSELINGRVYTFWAKSSSTAGDVRNVKVITKQAGNVSTTVVQIPLSSLYTTPVSTSAYYRQYININFSSSSFIASSTAYTLESSLREAGIDSGSAQFVLIDSNNTLQFATTSVFNNSSWTRQISGISATNPLLKASSYILDTKLQDTTASANAQALVGTSYITNVLTFGQAIAAPPGVSSTIGQSIFWWD